MTTQKHPGGRPTKLTSKLRAAIFFLARRGCTEAQISEVLGIAKSTLNNWKGQIEFLDSLKRSKDVADDLVERSLFERALGYEFAEEQVIGIGRGEQEVVQVRRRLPPDVTAYIFWLKNRRRDQWRDRSECKHAGALTLEELVTNSRAPCDDSR